MSLDSNSEKPVTELQHKCSSFKLRSVVRMYFFFSYLTFYGSRFFFLPGSALVTEAVTMSMGDWEVPAQEG